MKLTYGVGPAVIAIVLAGCGETASPSTNPLASVPTCATGTITASGSTALQPLVQAAATAYQQACAGSVISVAGGGSSTGLANAAAGTSDIGDSDVPVSDATAVNAASVTDHLVAIVVFAIVVNNGAGVSNLTPAQIQGVFSGTITNWSQAGGNNVPVTLIERKPGSGTRISFDKDLMGGVAESTAPAATQDSTSLVVQSVANQGTPGAVSYINVASVTGGMSVVSISGVLPAAVNVAAGTYGFYSHEHMYTKGAGPTLAQSFIQYIAGPFQAKLPTGFAVLATTAALSLSDK